MEKRNKLSKLSNSDNIYVTNAYQYISNIRKWINMSGYTNVAKCMSTAICVFFIFFYMTACGVSPGPSTKPAPTPTVSPSRLSVTVSPPASATPAPEPTPSPVTSPSPPSTTAPTPKANDSSKIPKNTVISSYTTPVLDQSPSRMSNLKLASKKINGKIVKPGVVFSFNNVVGKREEETGFKEAKIIKEGKVEYDEGGGVCQVSSTLFNAAQKADMEIIERHNHTKEVHYVPPGQDAAISYGSMDFKFRNTKDYSIKISAYVKGDQMIVSLLKAR